MQITPYSLEYWSIASITALVLYVAGIYFDLTAPKKQDLVGFYYSLAVISYLTGLFIVASLGLQYVGYTVIDYMKTSAATDISSGLWAESFFPWNSPPLIALITGAAFIAIIIVGITAFRIGVIYHKIKEV